MLAPALAVRRAAGLPGLHRVQARTAWSSPTTGVALAANALPLQLGFYFAMLWAGSVMYQYGQMVASVHPLNRRGAACRRRSSS